MSFVVMAPGLLLTACDTEKVPRELSAVEITEYEGKDLSSIEDFKPTSIKGVQEVERETYRLQVLGAVDNPMELSYDEVVDRYQPYRKVVTLNCVAGWSVDILWEGFLMRDLIAEAGPSANVTHVILRAYDGYSTSLPIGYFYDNDIITAYRMNGVELPPERGFPFQLVAESKWGYKWIRWITSIELSETEYWGYWETQGYTQDGDLDKYFYEWID